MASIDQGGNPAMETPCIAPRSSSLAPVLCHVAALALMFWGLFRLDHALQEYMRQLHVLWLERTGDLLYLIGTGTGLVIISLLVLLAGYVRHNAALWNAAKETLIAHGAVALVVQLLKHTIGRPRPRMMRDDEFFTGPSLVSGLDSFPSGHSSASFAVATVLAVRFPSWAASAYSAAALITLSRVIRGSHFTTDVIAGVLVGVLVGAVVVHGWRDWRDSLVEALKAITPFLIGVFAVIWTLAQPVADPDMYSMMLWTGGLMIALGAGSRWGAAFRGEPTLLLPYAIPVVAIGLSLATGAWIVVAAALFAVVAREIEKRMNAGCRSSLTGVGSLARESVHVALVVSAVFMLQQCKGLLTLE